MTDIKLYEVIALLHVTICRIFQSNQETTSIKLNIVFFQSNINQYRFFQQIQPRFIRRAQKRDIWKFINYAR